MYTLFWERQSGAIVPQSMFEELRIPYQKTWVDMDAGNHRKPDYLAINPTGQVPALRLLDGRIVSESAAMVVVLGERHPEAALVPGTEHESRPDFLRWLLYMATSGYMGYLRVNHPERFAVDTEAISQVAQCAMEHLDSVFDVIEAVVAGDPYFLADGYSALDIYLAMLVNWHWDQPGLLARSPKIRALCMAVEQRPAIQRVWRDHGIGLRQEIDALGGPG